MSRAELENFIANLEGKRSLNKIQRLALAVARERLADSDIGLDDSPDCGDWAADATEDACLC